MQIFWPNRSPLFLFPCRYERPSDFVWNNPVYKELKFPPWNPNCLFREHRQDRKERIEFHFKFVFLLNLSGQQLRCPSGGGAMWVFNMSLKIFLFLFRLFTSLGAFRHKTLFAARILFSPFFSPQHGSGLCFPQSSEILQAFSLFSSGFFGAVWVLMETDGPLHSSIPLSAFVSWWTPLCLSVQRWGTTHQQFLTMCHLFGLKAYLGQLGGCRDQEERYLCKLYKQVSLLFLYFLIVRKKYWILWQYWLITIHYEPSWLKIYFLPDLLEKFCEFCESTFKKWR